MECSYNPRAIHSVAYTYIKTDTIPISCSCRMQNLSRIGWAEWSSIESRFCLTEITDGIWHFNRRGFNPYRSVILWSRATVNSSTAASAALQSFKQLGINELSSRRLRRIIAGVVNHLNAVTSLCRWRLITVYTLCQVCLDSGIFLENNYCEDVQLHDCTYYERHAKAMYNTKHRKQKTYIRANVSSFAMT